MIALLTGKVAALDAASCVIDVGGVGYLVQASTRTLADLPSPPALARLLIETIVREDAILLYGFSSQAERDWFRLLTTIQGVGAKVALAILGALPANDLAAALAGGDRAALTRVPGVGPKLAIRLLTELQGKAGTIAITPFSPGQKTPSQDALSALANLGYRRQEAEPALARVLESLGEAAPLEAVLRMALQELARK